LHCRADFLLKCLLGQQCARSRFISAATWSLFDHLVGTREQSLGYNDAERFFALSVAIVGAPGEFTDMTTEQLITELRELGYDVRDLGVKVERDLPSRQAVN
jgi:hypothetical protein